MSERKERKQHAWNHLCYAKMQSTVMYNRRNFNFKNCFYSNSAAILIKAKERQATIDYSCIQTYVDRKFMKYFLYFLI